MNEKEIKQGKFVVSNPPVVRRPNLARTRLYPISSFVRRIEAAPALSALNLLSTDGRTDGRRLGFRRRRRRRRRTDASSEAAATARWRRRRRDFLSLRSTFDGYVPLPLPVQVERSHSSENDSTLHIMSQRTNHLIACFLAMRCPGSKRKLRRLGVFIGPRLFPIMTVASFKLLPDVLKVARSKPSMSSRLAG